ncbi:MAG: Hit [Candidatus Jorgensenbacteria bacterium GW2011_GWA1_48_11]|uniref:Hit n=1 Tax=Candidatus Jorgensenbacteria bacterium GW2011_GWA1_48_11 TaxID=1618660 RepID=A0A0G1UC94_9BACT|nr:MAG: Hit [Candidatus Jorgensenbacteria bacterium GW2011_GWA1_48_11]KKW12225.1 MAG: Hit [Candidatus Jorgensenbacteria bacterium GW2011_GWB1_49_9]
MVDCLFCKIARKEIPAAVTYEDETVIIFKDIQPKAPVHLLVVPKEHIESIGHLKGDHREIVSKIIFAAKEEAAKNNLKGYKLVFNVGRAGGQLIDHLHLHLLGGWTEGVAQSLNV